jgi:hypothetical protein
MAQQTDRIGEDLRQAFAYETLTVSTTALSLTAATYDTVASASTAGRAQKAFITANDQPARFRWDGGTPTASVGHKLAAGETIVVTGIVNMRNFRIIREGATDVNLAVTYER